MKISHFVLTLLFVLSFSACHSGPKITRFDTMTSGKATVLCEDCFSPIIQEEIGVFQGLYPEASVHPIYTDEVTAMNLLIKDSIRTVIAARDLTGKEFNYFPIFNYETRSNLEAWV